MTKKVLFSLLNLFLYTSLFANNLNLELSKFSDPTNFNPNKIKELISKGADVNHKNKWGNTPLIMAVIYKDMDLITFLMSKGADPHLKNKRGIS